MQLRLHWVWFEVEPRTVLEDGLALSTSTRAILAISGNGSRSCWPLNRRIPLIRYRKRSMPSLPTLGNAPGPIDRAHCTLLYYISASARELRGSRGDNPARPGCL